MSEKFNGKPMTPENQRDEDLKKVKENLYRKLTELRLDNPKFGEPLEELVDAALTAQRQSWEREKEELIAESKRAEKEWGYKSEDHYIDKCRRQEAESRIRILEAEKQALEAEKKGLETQLSAWFSTFGTNQLSHAIDRLESAEKEKARLEERVRDMDECLDEQHDELTRLKSRNEELERDKDNLLHSVERLEEWQRDIQKRFDERYATPNEHEKHLIAQPLREEISRLKAKVAELEREANAAVESFISFHHNPVVRQKNEELDRLKAENERLFKNSVENEKIFIRNQSALARAHEALEPFATLTEYDVMSAPVAVGWLTNARKALSDPSGSVAFEKWKKMEAVVVAAKWAKEHLEINLWKSLGASPDEDIDDEDRPQGLIKLREALEALDAKGGVK